MAESLLPGHYAPLEHALDKVGGSRLEAITSPIAKLWHADDCPAEHLPLLAWSLSVDYWNSNWPEHIKRQVIKLAPELHRIKGTQAAIVKALASLNVDADYAEWWQQQPKAMRGTFEITALLKDNLDESGDTLLGPAQIKELKKVINAVKRGSQHYTLKTGVSYTSPLTLAGAKGPASNHSDLNLNGLLPPTAKPRGHITIAGGSAPGVTVSDLHLEAA